MPGQMGAVLYEGMPPYIAPTPKPGRVLDTARSDIVLDELRTIAQVELYTILWGLRLCAHKLQGKLIRLWSDNQNARHALISGMSVDPVRSTRAALRWECILSNHFTVTSIDGVPSELNI